MQITNRVDVGTDGSCFHAHTFAESELLMAILDGSIGLLEDKPLPGDERNMHYFLTV